MKKQRINTVTPKYSVKNIKEGLTLSGISADKVKLFHTSWLGALEDYFSTVPWMHFNLKDGSKKNFDRAQSYVDQMSQYNFIGDFLIDPEIQTDELAAYTWIVLDRVVRHAQARKSGWDAMKYVFELWECVRPVDPEIRPFRSFYRKGISGKKAKNVKQIEKKFVRECWEKWQKSPSNYPSQAEFARDMLTKCTHLKSQKKIEDWCRDWKNPKPSPY